MHWEGELGNRKAEACVGALEVGFRCVTWMTREKAEFQCPRLRTLEKQQVPARRGFSAGGVPYAQSRSWVGCAVTRIIPVERGLGQLGARVCC